MDNKELTALGLNQYEAKAFEALVRLGKSGASEIARDSQVPYGRIYDILESLVGKGLAKIIPEQNKKYVPGDPAILERLLKKKEQELRDLRVNIISLKKQYAESPEEVIVVAKGKRNFYSVTKNLPKPTEQYNIKYSVEWHPQWVKEQKGVLKSDKFIKNLVRITPTNLENIKKWKTLDPRIKMRRLDNEGVAASITDKYAWFALINSNTLMVVKDKAFIKLMKTLFNNTWEHAEEA